MGCDSPFSAAEYGKPEPYTTSAVEKAEAALDWYEDRGAKPHWPSWHVAEALRALLAEHKQVVAERDRLQRALRATDDYRVADWLKLEQERDTAEAERDEAVAEMHARELHHFETEKRVAELEAVIERARGA